MKGKTEILSEGDYKIQAICYWVVTSVFFILASVNILYYNSTHGMICLAIGAMFYLRLGTLKENFVIYKKLSEIEDGK